jgi:hypothetical protein
VRQGQRSALPVVRDHHQHLGHALAQDNSSIQRKAFSPCPILTIVAMALLPPLCYDEDVEPESYRAISPYFIRGCGGPLFSAHVRTHVHTPYLGAINHSYISIISSRILIFRCYSVLPFRGDTVYKYSETYYCGTVTWVSVYNGLTITHPPSLIHLFTFNFAAFACCHHHLDWLPHSASNR